MPRIDSRYDPINRDKRGEKENLIPGQAEKNTKIIKKMYENFKDGVKELQKGIDDEKKLAWVRDHVGAWGWSLKNKYGYDIKEKELKKLGVVLHVGKVIPRGQSGSR